MEGLKNSGSCRFCSAEFSRQGMGRHLTSCPARVESVRQITPKLKREIFHVCVSGKYDVNQWLHLEVHSNAFLSALDIFLRDIWLECCGHLSSFEIDGIHYESAPAAPFDGFDFGYRAQSTRIRTEKVLKPRLRFEYEYDFGSTTHLQLRVIERRLGAFPKEDVALIARNNPPTYLCVACNAPATQICAQCGWTAEAWFCDLCAREHACGEELFLPVVNSPRMGVCGYTG